MKNRDQHVLQARAKVIRSWFLALPRKKKILTILVAICIVIGVTYWPERYPYVLTKDDFKEADAVSQREVEVLAKIAAVMTVDGETRSLRQLYNEKPVVLGFWASWSTLSQQQLGIMNDLYKTYGRDVYFVMACIDRKDLETIGPHWPYDMPFYSVSHGVLDDYNVYDVPMVYVIERYGKIYESCKDVVPEQKMAYMIERALQGESR